MQHAALRQMAAEILERHRTGVEFTPDTLGWAAWIHHTQPKHIPSRLGEHQTAVLEALMRAPLEGMLFSEMQAATGIDGDVLHQTVHKMVKHGLIVTIYIPHRSRYFLCDQSLQLGRAIVEADEARLKASMPAKKQTPKTSPAEKPLKIPKFITGTRHPNKAPLTVKQQKQEATPAYKHHTLNQPPTGPAMSVVEQALGGEVKVTVHPTPPDRFAPRPGDVGAGFLDDWKNKRGGAA
jgi:DNA-binding HxlR family transcriptional regulator